MDADTKPAHPVMIPHGYPVQVPRTPVDSFRPTLLQQAMSDSYSCSWVQDLLRREDFTG